MAITFTNISALIKKRKSCRSFSTIPLKDSDRQAILGFIDQLDISNLPVLSLQKDKTKLTLISEDFTKHSVDSFRMFKNAKNILMGSVTHNTLSYEIYGYLLELIVLKCTELNIESCWLGFFNKHFFKQFKKPDQVIPVILVLGYSGKRSIRDNVIRLAAKSDRRQAWESLFFENSFNSPITENQNHPLYLPLDLLRHAPSSGNTQPWRILCQNSNQNIHFFMKTINKSYDKRNLHNIDMGIAMSHFDLGLKESNLQGEWEIIPDLKIENSENLQYILSWKQS